MLPFLAVGFLSRPTKVGKHYLTPQMLLTNTLKPKTMKTFHYLALLPLLWLTAFYTLCIRTWLWVGHLPNSTSPNPTEIPFTIHYQLVYNSLIFVLSAPVLWVGATLFFWLFKKQSPLSQPKYLIFNFCSYFILFLIIQTDPFGLINWLAD